MNLKNVIRKLVRKAGYDIIRYDPTMHSAARRMKILESFDIALVIDAGANTGQFGREIRDYGYKGNIESFEPLRSAFEVLMENTRNDPSWQAHNLALGDRNGRADINISANSYSSSLLDMLPAHLNAAPESRYIGSETVEIRTLDSIFASLNGYNEIFLKIDTQGYEQHVLNGAINSLPHIGTIQIEMSLIPLYDEERPFMDMYQYLDDLGYELISIETGLSDNSTGRLLQIDGIFHRKC